MTLQKRRIPTLAGLLALTGFLAVTGCGGGGGSSGDKRGQLLALHFPDPGSVNPEPETSPPLAAPLNQQIEFEFSARPNADEVSHETIRIRDSRGVAPEGTFHVEGVRVVFVPKYPLRPVRVQDGRVTDDGGAGFAPGESYTIQVGPGTWPTFLSSVQTGLKTLFQDPTNGGDIALVLGTTRREGDYFRGVRIHRPSLVESVPADGASSISPQLYRDPAGLFPPPRPFLLRFDGPIHPSESNLEGFRLIDLDHRRDSSMGLSLGIDVCLLENSAAGAVVSFSPSGILPFGHLISLEYPTHLQGLGEEGTPRPGTSIAATFTVAEAPSGTIVDLLQEDFDSSERESRNLEELGSDRVPAEWDTRDSDVLTANFAFQGRGELGRLQPFPGTAQSPNVLILDTSSQSLPLLEGSTPDARPGVVLGGVFSFTDIDIPEHVILRPRGPNPLVLTATGSVRIAGTILMEGGDAPHTRTIDSSTTPMPGGATAPGGGRGGEGHPTTYFGVPSRRNLISPLRGGHGWGPSNLLRLGGRGGTTGSLDTLDENGAYATDQESTCTEGVGHNPGFRPSGGGGGSLLTRGARPQKDGYGNVIPDGMGGHILRTPETHGADSHLLPGGEPGLAVFRDDDPNNDFIGSRGELQDIVGGQGGGAGGSGFDTYFCGSWCKKDDDPTNNRVCKAELGLGAQLPDTITDGRGGGGGGGGGALWIKALGEIVFESTAHVSCRGGNGGGGEWNSCGSIAGSGGGGSGGAALFQSGAGIHVKEGAVIDAAAGRGRGAARNPNGCALGLDHPGAGGSAGAGIIQLQVPPGQTAQVEDRSSVTGRAWVDKNNVRNPSEFTPISVALTQWYDMGRVIDRPPKNTNPVYSFQGLDPETGQVLTDEFGNVLDPQGASIRVDFLGVSDPRIPGRFLPGKEPKANFIPPNATIHVEFEGADAVSPGSKEADPLTRTGWSPNPEVANGKQFLRYRITFDIAARAGDTLTPETPRPTVQEIAVRAEF